MNIATLKSHVGFECFVKSKQRVRFLVHSFRQQPCLTDAVATRSAGKELRVPLGFVHFRRLDLSAGRRIVRSQGVESVGSSPRLNPLSIGSNRLGRCHQPMQGLVERFVVNLK